ncbi:hypothetical protein DL93DRAFT_822626 [Clavulina sp. PMI_390]|nr:hypothetical protein DL93DRAFT_822626 [Clavulina sp. PMI_390]
MAKQLHNITIRRRGEALRAALVASEIDDDEGFDRAFNKFEARQKAAGSAKQALRDAQELVIHAKQVVKTQGSAAATGYLGIADWAQDAYDSYDNLMTAITGVSFVGAGLTYGAIFSATRGSIGLMAWAFSLFIVGLAIVIPVQALLRWCSRLDNYPFSTPRVWELFLAVGVYGASASAFAAISLLVVTVLSLHFNVTSEPYNNSNAANWDAHLEFDVSPGPSAKFAFAFIGLGILGVVLVFAFFAGANGMNVFLWRRSMMRKHKMLDRIEDLEKQITGVPLGGDAEKAEIATVD